ncbi:MAG: STELLO glycosyltransferase family protein [Bacteroidia bacterium]
MNPKTSLVITSISPPISILQDYARECYARDIEYIIIGDSKSPDDFFIDHCRFFSIASQKDLNFKIAHQTPERHYSRKNIGYLIAIAGGAEIIAETDDDNIPLSGFWKPVEMKTSCYHFVDKGWINIYSYFTDKKIWPRAFPLEFLRDSQPAIRDSKYEIVDCPIQQGLANDNPDVDAIFRLVKELPVHFKHGPSIALGKNTWCPFNSQNTRWFKPSFPLLYLPTYCSFRMTDIWRSFIAQRICWENNWSVLFHKPTVYQQRNDHNLIRDLKDEVPGYLNNNQIAETLQQLALKQGVKHLNDNLLRCYEALIKLNLIDEKELVLLDSWIADLASIEKSNPLLQSA